MPDTGTLSCLWSRQHYLPYPNTIFVGVSGRKLHRGDWIPFDGSEAVTRFGEIVNNHTILFRSHGYIWKCTRRIRPYQHVDGRRILDLHTVMGWQAFLL